jgi:hypothetical protein
MKLNKPKNLNYCATVVEVKTLISLDNCDNVKAAIIMGNQVIVGNDVKIGDVGLFFPVECQLSSKYLKENNLYRKPELNLDVTQKGYFEENGRIRCIKFRGNKSEGLFMPITSVGDFIKEDDDSLFIGDEFDELNGINICKKYVPIQRNLGNKYKISKKPKPSKIIENQFRFHENTSQLYKNLNKINPEDIISITYKLHGTSGISSKVLCKKPLKWYEKLLRKIGINIVDTQYDYIYSSRKVIKNSNLNPNANHFYKEDIWGMAHERIKEHLQEGMTLYYEIVGYLPSGGYIQKDYEYGCEQNTFKVYIYRITYTNLLGKIFEFSAKQVQDWCKYNGLNAVPQLWYGVASEYYNIFKGPEYSNKRKRIRHSSIKNGSKWQERFLEDMKTMYNDKDCFMCTNKVPEEGCVIRIEKSEFEAYKCKSNLFYLRETALLDKGEIDIEEQ